MEDPTFEPSEIYKNDQKQINKIIEDIYQFLYFNKKRYKKNISNNNNVI